jgi:hypothetical protein
MKPFNQQFEDYRLQVSGLTSLAEESYMFWFKNYANQNSQFNPKEFITGKIYSFEYNDKLEKNKKFVNKRPVIFFTGFSNKDDKNYFQGIDLILIPPMVRIALLTRITGVYSSQIETNSKKDKEGDKKSQIQLKTDYEILDTIFKGIPFKNSYRLWDLKKIRSVVEIPYEEWTRIVYLHTRSIEGSPIEEIYKKNMQI